MNQRVGALLSGLMLCACHTAPPITPPEMTAVLITPTPSIQQQLSANVAKMLGVAQVSLANNTLIENSYFAIERIPRRNTAGQLLQGRVLERPHTFRLLIQGEACWLEYVNTGKRMLLAGARCQAHP